jgi:hypothetical protein
MGGAQSNYVIPLSLKLTLDPNGSLTTAGIINHFEGLKILATPITQFMNIGAATRSVTVSTYELSFPYYSGNFFGDLVWSAKHASLAAYLTDFKSAFASKYAVNSATSDRIYVTLPGSSLKRIALSPVTYELMTSYQRGGYTFSSVGGISSPTESLTTTELTLIFYIPVSSVGVPLTSRTSTNADMAAFVTNAISEWWSINGTGIVELAPSWSLGAPTTA